MTIHFYHEKLHVYHRAVAFASWSDDLVKSITRRASAKDHLQRAAISVPVNIAEGNAKTSLKECTNYIEVAIGSALECAACTDVLAAKELIDDEQGIDGKEQLHAIVSMLHGLKRSKADIVAEEPSRYGDAGEANRPCFDHERLEVYHNALGLVSWCSRVEEKTELGAHIADMIDRSSTGIVLNIAEGNARFSLKDRGRFLDMAITASFKCAAVLDVVSARSSGTTAVQEGKALLAEIARMLYGLKRSVASRSGTDDEGRWGSE